MTSSPTPTCLHLSQTPLETSAGKDEEFAFDCSIAGMWAVRFGICLEEAPPDSLQTIWRIRMKHHSQRRGHPPQQARTTRTGRSTTSRMKTLSGHTTGDCGCLFCCGWTLPCGYSPSMTGAWIGNQAQLCRWWDLRVWVSCDSSGCAGGGNRDCTVTPGIGQWRQAQPGCGNCVAAVV